MKLKKKKIIILKYNKLTLISTDKGWCKSCFAGGGGGCCDCEGCVRGGGGCWWTAAIVVESPKRIFLKGWGVAFVEACCVGGCDRDCWGGGWFPGNDIGTSSSTIWIWPGGYRLSKLEKENYYYY